MITKQVINAINNLKTESEYKEFIGMLKTSSAEPERKEQVIQYINDRFIKLN